MQTITKRITILATAICLLACLLLAFCGGCGGGSGGTTDSTGPTPITENWSGTWVSQTPAANGAMAVEIKWIDSSKFSGNGTITLTGNQDLGSATATFTRTVNLVTMNATFSAGYTGKFQGKLNADNNAMSGSYEAYVGQETRTGTFSLTLQN